LGSKKPFKIFIDKFFLSLTTILSATNCQTV
jgi:hypothetical protein